MTAIPEGFHRLEPMSPFHELVGPLFERRDERGLTIGFRVAEKHKNRRGIVHGGMICTLADFAMGHAASSASDPPRKLVTTTLSMDFAGNAVPGDWVEARVDLYRPGKRVAFVDCFIWRMGARPERIGRASATFLILRADE
ncbi:MAG: PaaI family thioesterase [Burkholderiales bacterium]|nr:PaaI family thioesterase [Burkholderiales bacterium]